MISHQTIDHMGLKLDLTEAGEVDIPFDVKDEITVEWYAKEINDQPVYSHDEMVCTVIYTNPVEIEGEIYRFASCILTT